MNSVISNKQTNQLQSHSSWRDNNNNNNNNNNNSTEVDSIFISVIIPAHNEENYLRSTLRALKQQTFQNFETIVVANGCTDKTEEIVKKRANERLKLLTISKANVSRARNYGASKAQGSTLVFLDADTILDKTSLQKISSEFKSGHSIATTKVRPFPDDLFFRVLMRMKNLANLTGIYKGWISGALICRKKDFQQVNGYDHLRVVREHRNLISKLLPHGRFVIINTYTSTSMRRYQQWGLIKMAAFWLKQLLRDNWGDITKSDYEKIR